MKFKLLTFLFFLSIGSYAQTYIKLNGATSLLGIPGIGIEVPISKKMSFQLDATMSFWNSVSIGKYSERPYVFNMIFPEIRYYTKSVNEGFYVGTHFGYGMFKVSKILDMPLKICISMDIFILQVLVLVISGK